MGNSPTDNTRAQVQDSMMVSSTEVILPSTQEAADAFEAMVDAMVARIMTCSICNRQGHLSSGGSSNFVCLICSKPGHHRRDCERIARQEGRVWKETQRASATINFDL